MSNLKQVILTNGYYIQQININTLKTINYKKNETKQNGLICKEYTNLIVSSNKKTDIENTFFISVYYIADSISFLFKEIRLANPL